MWAVSFLYKQWAGAEGRESDNSLLGAWVEECSKNTELRDCRVANEDNEITRQRVKEPKCGLMD